MEILTVLIPFLIGYTFTLAERSTCNSTIPHGRVYPYSCGNTLNLQECPYICDPGYEKNRLSTWLSCDRYTGRWTLYNPLNVLLPVFRKLKEEVLCSPRLCQSFIPNGILSESCEATVDSPPCYYTCRDGYVKTTKASLTCLTTARWDRDLFSLCTAQDGKQCSWILPDADLDLSCDRRPGSTCAYRCHTSYQSLNSPQEITCQGTDLTWSRKQLCSSVQCPYLIPNGRISVFCGLHVGSKCGVQCNDGYMATNNSLQVTCLSSGQWNLNPANLCQRRVRCPVIYKDGSIDYRCDGYRGSTCLYTCNQGFTRYQDQVLVTCLDNGNWNIDPNGYCVKDSVPSFSEPNVQTSSSIIVPVTLAIAAVTAIIVGVVIICFRSKYRTRRRCQSQATRTGSNRHIPMMFSVGQCRTISNLNLRRESQTSFHAHDMGPPPYTEVMKNSSANRDPPPSYEEVNACPSNFMTDTHI